MRYDPQLYYKLLMAALKQQGGVTPGVGMGMMGQQGLYQGGMGIAGQQGLYGQGLMIGQGLMKKKK